MIKINTYVVFILFIGSLVKAIYISAFAEARAKSAEAGAISAEARAKTTEARAISAEKMLEETRSNIEMMLDLRKNFIETVKKINFEFLEYNKKLQEAYFEIAELKKALANTENNAKTM
jgi:hypothetical protein